MDDVAALSDVTGPAMIDALMERFKHQQYYTHCGDVLLSFNPFYDVRENESELGQWYRKCKPLQGLPPHVVAIAHRAYRKLVHDVTPQAIVVMGRAGSGKTEACRRVVSQLLREARLSPKSGLGPRIVMAQHILTSLMTARTLDNPESTRGIKMATMYFRSDGRMVSAELQALCVDRWYLTDRRPGCGVFNVFYQLMAGLPDSERPLYYLTDPQSQYTDRLLSRNDSRAVFVDREDFQHHLQQFEFLLHCLRQTGIDEPTQNYAGKQLSAILAVLAAILHVANLDVTVNAQNGRLAFTNRHELASVCDLLAIGQEYLEAEILSTTAIVRGEPVRMMCSAEQALWNRDLLIVEMYRRLLSVVITRINHALAPNTHYIDHGPLSPISVMDASSQDGNVQGSTGGLEAFLRNMAHERLQHHLYDVIFHRDVTACERERVPPYKVKLTHNNADVVSAVFSPDYGILSRLRAVSLDPEGAPEKLVSLLDRDRALKKNPSYVRAGSKAVKGADVFFIKHAALGQVTYTASDFISKNRSSLPQSCIQMMLTSHNPLVPVLASVSFHESGFQPDVASPDSFFATRTFQGDLNYLMQTLENANLHHIRCLKASGSKTAGQFDSQLVSDQLKEGCVVETARQRKYGFAVCMTQDQFVRSYRFLAFSAFSRVTSTLEACRVILQRSGLEGRGVTLSKTSVFLRYWHVTRLDGLKADHVGKVVMTQAQARAFLARRRYRRLLASFAPRQEYSPGGYYVNGSTPDRQYHGSAGFLNESRSSLARDPGDGREIIGRSLADPSSSDPLVEDDPTGLYTMIMDKVLSTLHTLDPSTWVKIIYLERGRQVAKVYLEERSVIIDGSNAEFDGNRLGLGLCRNPERDEETAFIRSRIIEGIRLKQSSDDSISACRLCEQPVAVKGLGHMTSQGSLPLSEDVLLHRGHLPLEKTIKIFDMNEFRSKVALDLKQRCFSKAKMRRACVVGLALGRDDVMDVQTPCWLCVVNVKALAALESEEILRRAQVYSAELEATSPSVGKEKIKAEEAKTRHERGRWSRVDQREHLKDKEEGGRHVRHKLRAKGLTVGDHVGYSWDQPQPAEKATMSDLQEMVETQSSVRPSGRPGASGPARDWAKVETVIRDERKGAGLGTSSLSNIPSTGH